MTFDLSKASTELAHKSLREIQIETAYTWGARGIVAWRKYGETGGADWLASATEYLHEAREHAALARIAAEFEIELSAALNG